MSLSTAYMLGILAGIIAARMPLPLGSAVIALAGLSFMWLTEAREV